MGEKVAKSIVVDRRTGQPKHVLRRFDPNALGALHDFDQMLNAADAAEIDHEAVSEEKRKEIGALVMQKIHQWGLFKYLPKRGEMGNMYRMERTRETTGPGLKRVSDRQLDIEMDSVRVLVMCNPAEKPDRKEFTNDRSYEKEFRNRKVRIQLPLITGHPEIHVLPQACLAFSLLAEGMIRRNFEGIRYEIYDETDERHRSSDRKFRIAQDGRSLADDDSEAEAELWVSGSAMTQEEIDDSMEEEAGPVIEASIEPEQETVMHDLPASVEIPLESEDFKKYGLTFQIIYNRAQAGEQVKPMCKELSFDRNMYYRLKREHEARMEAINGPQTTDEPSGSEGDQGQHSSEPIQG